MMADLWSLVAAVSLALSAVAGGLAAFRTDSAWVRIFLGLRVTSMVAVAVALVGRAGTAGGWSPYDPQLSVLGLVLAMLIVHSVLAWLLKAGPTGPLVELAGLGLLLVGAAGLPAGTLPLPCPQEVAWLQIQWALFLLGGGSLLVAGCMGLTLMVDRAVQSRGRSVHLATSENLYTLLVWAVKLAFVTVGSGLTIGLWWAWRSLGTLASGDPRAEWMALAWLLTAMSLLAGQLERHQRWWVAGLAGLAALNVIFGWLFLVGLQDLLGF